MSLLVRARRSGKEIVKVTPQSAGWNYVGFAAYRLGAGETITLDADRLERCIVILSGTVTVRAGDDTWTEIGGRGRRVPGRSPPPGFLSARRPASGVVA